jgi:hypothetical protein
MIASQSLTLAFSDSRTNPPSTLSAESPRLLLIANPFFGQRSTQTRFWIGINLCDGFVIYAYFVEYKNSISWIPRDSHRACKPLIF